MNWKLWGQGLLSAALSGGAALGAGYVGQWAQTTASGTTAPISGKTAGILTGAGAIIGVINYLVKSPLQPAPPAKP